MKFIVKILGLISIFIIFTSELYADQSSTSNFYSFSSGRINFDDQDFKGDSNLVSINSGINITEKFSIESSFIHFGEIKHYVRTYEEPLFFRQNLTILHAYGFIITPVLTQNISKHFSLSGKIGISTLYVNRKTYDGSSFDDAINYKRKFDLFYSASAQAELSVNFSLGVSISRLKVDKYEGDIISGTIKYTY